MRPEATAHYREHPMGYACRDCGSSANVGSAVRHTGLCDIAPRQAVWPAWPEPAKLAQLDELIIAGDIEAIGEMEIALGLRPPAAIGSWTRWRKTGEWAIRISADVVPGTPVLVVRRDTTSSTEIAGETLWTDGTRSIVRVRTSDSDEEPCTRAYIFSRWFGGVLPEVIVVVSTSVPPAPGTAPWSVRSAARATREDAPQWSWTIPTYAWTLDDWCSEIWHEELVGRPYIVMGDETDDAALKAFKEAASD